MGSVLMLVSSWASSLLTSLSTSYAVALYRWRIALACVLGSPPGGATNDNGVTRHSMMDPDSGRASTVQFFYNWSMSFQIRPYEPTSDREAVFQLWQAALGDVWPLYPVAFYDKIDPPAAHHLVADSQGKLSGLAAQSWDGRDRGHIFALVVHPDHRGEGLENMLLAAATEHFRNLGVKELRFGGGQSYFWPGVPADQPYIRQLLEQNGWKEGGQLTDMVSDVANSQVPVDIIDRIAHSSANLRLATPEDGPAILAFEEEHFPEWRLTASMMVAHKDFANTLLAELDGTVVGTNFLTSPRDPTFLWGRALGANCAAYGAIGVSKAVRGRYIGYALALGAAEILKARGAKKIFLGWVFSTEWYGRLGFQAWKTYHEMSAELS
jgi:N-acetylglutamate synthase-like GNAT family acetyltransferase